MVSFRITAIATGVPARRLHIFINLINFHDKYLQSVATVASLEVVTPGAEKKWYHLKSKKLSFRGPIMLDL